MPFSSRRRSVAAVLPGHQSRRVHPESRAAGRGGGHGPAADALRCSTRAAAQERLWGRRRGESGAGVQYGAGRCVDYIRSGDFFARAELAQRAGESGLILVGKRGKEICPMSSKQVRDRGLAADTVTIPVLMAAHDDADRLCRSDGRRVELEMRSAADDAAAAPQRHSGGKQSGGGGGGRNSNSIPLGAPASATAAVAQQAARAAVDNRPAWQTAQEQEQQEQEPPPLAGAAAAAGVTTARGQRRCRSTCGSRSRRRRRRTGRHRCSCQAAAAT